MTKTGEKESKSRNVTSITKNVRGNKHVKSNRKQHPSALQKRKTPDNSLLADTSVDSESQLDKTGKLFLLLNMQRLFSLDTHVWMDELRLYIFYNSMNHIRTIRG